MNKVERIKELSAYLNICRDSYYNSNNSLISDKKYDELYDELESLESETGVIMVNSPTQNVGFEVISKLEKTKHSHLMLSLGKTKSVIDLKKFAGENECLLMHKLDGLTVLLTYDNGVLIKAESRGDGEIGELITHNAKVFENIPLKIDYKGYLEVEGEAIITFSNFEAINENLPVDEKYKNPRNLVSGSVRQLDSSIAAKRHIRFIAWKLPITKLDVEVFTYTQSFEFLEKQGFDVVPNMKVIFSDTGEDYERYIYSLKQESLDRGYPIDGMVITYNNIKYGKSLGVTGHHPHNSLAYKFYEDEETTTLRDIEWSLGKTGQITPVAIFDPVDITGSTITRASVHNISILTELDLHIGDEITVIKANDVIPQIRENLSKTKEGRYIPLPGTCPICGGTTKVTKDNDSLVLTCTNPDCKGKLLGKLTHFVSKNAMNIEGLSEATLEKFIELGWLNSFKDIYELEKYKSEMYKLEGFGKKSVDKLLESIEKSSTTTLDKFIYSLSIPLIGKTASKTITKFIENREEYSDGSVKSPFERFINAIRNGFDWRNLEDFGDKMNDSIHKYFEENIDEVIELSSYMIFESNNMNSIYNRKKDLTGQVFVITGSLELFKNRNEAVKEIESLGGKVSGSVSKNTKYLVNNDVNSTSFKNKKAKELGIPIISEEQLIDMIR